MRRRWAQGEASGAAEPGVPQDPGRGAELVLPVVQVRGALVVPVDDERPSLRLGRGEPSPRYRVTGDADGTWAVELAP